MDTDPYEKLLQETKYRYFQIGKIACPALGGRYVYFNKHGFNHFLRKGKLPREKNDKIRRLQLFPGAPMVVSRCKIISNYRHDVRGTSHAHFWELHGTINGKIIKVVIRKMNTGDPHFFSIMTI